ncbi:MAG: type I restriction enzyme HsdR N-terminal domain-containing protein [Opitutae bacterium]|nr:type I restriction enzyme HsdR N-terminal domain-containing protein [Opitutae bacterium]
MASIPAKVETRIKESLKRFQPVLAQAKARDVGEADTSTLCKDIIAEMFGFDKYSEITAEYQIKSTYCDLAIKIEGKLVLLIEVKAINTELKEAQIKQAVDYGANQGIEWVVLTNAQHWQIYKITYGQPIGSELLVTLDLNTLNPKSKDDVEALFLLSREAQSKSLLSEYHQQRQALSRFAIGAVVLSDPVLAVIRRELKRLSPDVKIEIEEITHVITEEVIKRDVLEGDRAAEAKRKVSKAASKQLRAKPESAEVTPDAPPPSATVTAAAATPLPPSA